jgi:thymidylate synthase ThyX
MIKVTGLSLRPPDTALHSGNPEVTPELLASCLARYSRSNEGLESIIRRIDPFEIDKSVDNIFKFVDYGHASIGGLTGGIPIAIDGLSMFMAYKLFEIAQLCDGQESSTRYINFKELEYNPAEFGIPVDCGDDWEELMNKAIKLYQDVYQELDTKIRKDPSILKLPKDLDSKVVDRMRKNYALDRARNFIPFATKTAAAYVMTARNWCDTIMQLESLPYLEAVLLAQMLRDELAKYTPRLIKHSHKTEASVSQALSMLNFSLNTLKNQADGCLITDLNSKIFFTILGNIDDFPSFLPLTQSWDDAFSHKTNRYSTVGANIKRLSVRVAWNNMGIAELRDLNRHRSGFRFSPLVPVGFSLDKQIWAIDRLGKEINDFVDNYSDMIVKLSTQFDRDEEMASQVEVKPKFRATYVYGLLLGTQVAFEHTTQLDKFIYEIELRTGLGTHYRYAEHLRHAYEMLIEQLPEIKDYIEIGTSEPDTN